MIRRARAAAALACLAALASACAPSGPPVPPPFAPPPLETETLAPAAAYAPAPPADTPGLVASFEMIGPFHEVGGRFGAWWSGPPDPLGQVSLSVGPEGAGGGSALRIAYDISAGEGGRGAYGGIWMHLEGFDARPYGVLAFSLRGEEAASDLFVELKTDSNRRVGRVRVSGVGPTWRRFRLPVGAFALGDTSALSEMALVLDRNVASDPAGTILLDDVAFE